MTNPTTVLLPFVEQPFAFGFTYPSTSSQRPLAKLFHPPISIYLQSLQQISQLVPYIHTSLKHVSFSSTIISHIPMSCISNRDLLVDLFFFIALHCCPTLLRLLVSFVLRLCAVVPCHIHHTHISFVSTYGQLLPCFNHDRVSCTNCYKMQIDSLLVCCCSRVTHSNL